MQHWPHLLSSIQIDDELTAQTNSACWIGPGKSRLKIVLLWERHLIWPMAPVEMFTCHLRMSKRALSARSELIRADSQIPRPRWTDPEIAPETTRQLRCQRRADPSKQQQPLEMCRHGQRCPHNQLSLQLLRRWSNNRSAGWTEKMSTWEASRGKQGVS